jgi:hypothetical protein
MLRFLFPAHTISPLLLLYLQSPRYRVQKARLFTMAAAAFTPQRAFINSIRAGFGLDPATGQISNSRAFRNLEKRCSNVSSFF